MGFGNMVADVVTMGILSLSTSVRADEFLFNFLFITILYPMVYQQNPVVKINAITASGKNTTIAYQDYNSAFLFNTANDHFKMKLFQNPDSLKQYLNANSDTMGETYIITRQDRLASIDTSFYTIVAKHHDLFENPTSVLLRKK